MPYELYFGSAEFSTLAESTRKETRYVIEAICRHPRKNSGGTRGMNHVATLQRSNIQS